jgi:protein-disulfide isomerase
MTMALLTVFFAAQLAAAQPAQIAAPSPADAVTIVLYSDFQCPFCAQLSKPFRELQTKGVDGVKPQVTFKHFPLVIHPKAQLAHQAALAAAEQGKFWEMHDLLFANQRGAERENLLAYAQQLGLNIDRFKKDLDNAQVKARIEADKADGEKLGLTGTPTFFVNGKPYVGARSLDQLKQIVQGERQRTRALAEVTDSTMSRGPSDAPVTVELFADLESPVSRPAIAVLNQLMQRYPTSVRLQFRNFPLSFHPQATLAHEAAMTAAREGRFWEFASYVLDHQDSVREQDLIALASRLGLDEVKFSQTLQQHRYAARVDADLQAGARLGIRGSPVVLVNGKRIDGVPSLQALTDLVEAALTSVQRAPQPQP